MAADYPHGFVYTKGQETVFTNCPDCTSFLSELQSVPRLRPQQRGHENQQQSKTQNPLDGKIKMLRIACSAARKLCFPFRLHKRVSFHAGVLMQLALLFPNVCQIVLRFQRVKETLSSFSFRGPGSNLATFLAGNLLSFLLFFPRIRTVGCSLNG